MKFSSWHLLLLAALLSLNCSTPKTEIAWTDSLSMALAQAKKDNRLVMVNFYADWCGWCKKMEAESFTDYQVVELSKKVVPVRLNTEKGEGIAAAAKYNAGVLPLTVLLDPQGRIVHRIQGYMPAKELSEEIEKTLAGIR